MTVSICIGSSCHLRGSYDIKNIFSEMIENNSLENKVNLEVAFCLGHCKDGVTIKVDDEIITGVTPQNAEEIFIHNVIDKLN